MTDRALTFTTAVGVVVRVHDGTADGRTNAHVALAAGLTDVNVLVIDVADLANDGHAVRADNAHFAGGHTDLSVAVLLRHQLSSSTGGADELSALAGVHLNVVDDGTDRDVGDGQAVAGLDISGGGRDDLVASLQADRSNDVALLAVLVLDESNERAAVGVILQTQDSRGDVHLVALEVDDAVLLLVAAAVMTDGDAAVAVAAGMLLLRLDQAAFGLGLLVDPLEGGHSHVTAGGGSGLKRLNSHFSYPPYTMPSNSSMVLESSASCT